MKSMTGFISESFEIAGKKFNVEIKSLNNKFLDTRIRLPRESSQWEIPLVALIKNKIARGRLEVNVVVEEDITEVNMQEAMIENARKVKDMLNTLKQKLSLSGKIDLATITQFKDIFTSKNTDSTENLLEPFVENFQKVLDVLNKVREKEGAFLDKDIRSSLTIIENAVKEIQILKKDALSVIEKNIREKIKHLAAENIDQGRFNQELVYYADKLDFSEELTRLSGHISLFKESIQKEAVLGRKLDFIIQEMHREINTLGVKCQNLTIAHIVVTIKHELEKIREQVQNVE